jgi:hypothetical protein
VEAALVAFDRGKGDFGREAVGDAPPFAVVPEIVRVRWGQRWPAQGMGDEADALNVSVDGTGRMEAVVHEHRLELQLSNPMQQSHRYN